MAQCRLAGGRGKQSERSKQRLGVASLYKIMCFALCAAINFYGTSVWRMWLLWLPFFRPLCRCYRCCYCCCHMLLLLLSATQRVYVIFWLCVPNGDKSSTGIKLFTWKIANKTRCAQQTMQVTSLHFPPCPLHAPACPLAPSHLKYSFNKFERVAEVRSSMCVLTSILKTLTRFVFTAAAVKSINLRSYGAYAQSQSAANAIFSAGVTFQQVVGGWLMENANMKLSKN